MTLNVLNDIAGLDGLINQLHHAATHIDHAGTYPESILRSLGSAGAFQVSDSSPAEARLRRLQLIERLSTACVSTGFLVWCQTAAIQYVTTSDNAYLQSFLLPGLEAGTILGGSGLSNPMKHLSGMETLRLRATRVDGGYTINGTLPFVSNLGPDHWFGLAAEIHSPHYIMAMIRCDVPGLTLRNHQDFAGLNGTRTATCYFHDAYVPDAWVLSHDAKSFIARQRPDFLISQSGMGLGLASASLEGMCRVQSKQEGTNAYLNVQPGPLQEQLTDLRQRIYRLAGDPNAGAYIEDARRMRLESALLALKAAESEILYRGAAGYLKKSASMRRLREALFIAIVTPAIKHLYRDLANTAT